MKQDLINWLNAISAEDEEEYPNQQNFSDGTGLLLAPLNQQPVNEPVFPVVAPQNFSKAAKTEPGEAEHLMLEIQNLQERRDAQNSVQGEQNKSGTSDFAQDIQDEPDIQDLTSGFQDETDASDFAQVFFDKHDVQNFHDETNSPGITDEFPADNNENENEDEDEETSAISHELHGLQEELKNLQGTLETETPDLQLSNDWKNADTGFELSLDEPPPEIWTKLNSEKEDPEKLDYEQTTSLQGAAYIPKHEHGTNFTQRLQRTLQNRKDKAEAARELEAEHKNHHPYIQKAIILCGTMLIALFFTWLGLWFMQRETPDGMNARAEKFYHQGKFNEAEEIYRRAYKRYPHILTFLSKLADSAEKAGHLQTSETAREEYLRNFPDDNKTGSEETLAGKQSPDKELKTKERGETDTETSKQQQSEKNNLPVEQPLTFEEYLHEGNNSFNVGMYNRAVINFFHALDINSNDPRPYIGLAGAYRAKGLYFDAKVILDEARKKFRRNPTIETERKFLREAN